MLEEAFFIHLLEYYKSERLMLFFQQKLKVLQESCDAAVDCIESDDNTQSNKMVALKKLRNALKPFASYPALYEKKRLDCFKRIVNALIKAGDMSNALPIFAAYPDLIQNHVWELAHYFYYGQAVDLNPEDVQYSRLLHATLGVLMMETNDSYHQALIKQIYYKLNHPKGHLYPSQMKAKDLYPDADILITASELVSHLKTWVSQQQEIEYFANNSFEDFVNAMSVLPPEDLLLCLAKSPVKERLEEVFSSSKVITYESLLLKIAHDDMEQKSYAHFSQLYPEPATQPNEIYPDPLMQCLMENENTPPMDEQDATALQSQSFFKCDTRSGIRGLGIATFALGSLFFIAHYSSHNPAVALAFVIALGVLTAVGTSWTIENWTAPQTLTF